MSTQNQTLDTCGCCEGLKTLTPVSVDNLPGLAAIVYRVGTHGSFKITMQSQLSGQRPLQALTTRDDTDHSIGLIDGWATVADVLTFYQERIANEGYLRTATERRSILELARLIGYELNPGVAASTYLAFTVEKPPSPPDTTDPSLKIVHVPSIPSTVKIAVGTKAQSVPGQDEKAQVFETIEEIEARGEWSELRPQLKKKEVPELGHKEIYLKGISTRLKPGDGLLMIGAERKADKGNENWDLRRITEVETDEKRDITKATWDEGLGWRMFSYVVTPAKKDFQVFAMRRQAFLFGHNAPDWRVMATSVRDEFRTCGLSAEYFDNIDFTNLKHKRTDPKIDFDWRAGQPHPSISSDTFSVRWRGFVRPEQSGNYTFFTTSDDRVRLSVGNKLIIDNWTGHTRPEDSGDIWLQAAKLYDIRLDYYERGGLAKIVLSWSGPGITKKVISPSYLYPPGNYDEWPDFNIASISGDPDADPIEEIYLDALYPQIVKGGWIVLVAPAPEFYREVYEVTDAVESSRKNFTLTAKTTRVKLKGENLREEFNDRVRDTVVFAENEELEIAEKPVTDPVEGNSIVLEKLLPDLEEKRNIIVSGKRIRVKIPSSARRLKLTSTDDSKTVQLSPNDTLIVMETPKTLLSGDQKWTLKDKNGLIGTVTAKPGRLEIIPAEKEDEVVSEFNTIDTVKPDSNPTVINLAQNLSNSFDRSTVLINANVAKATHGETRVEVLGSGDGSQEFQEFVLKQSPLTFVAANTPTGARTTLKIRVNDVLWEEVSTFFGHGPDERIYITRLNDDGKTSVIFGDGKTGARLPTGQENVKAEYRQGIGLDGMMEAEQISQLMSRPLGVKAVINPIVATGAGDSEERDKARQNAPLTVLTLDRIVSLQDYEDFARAFAGIEKAQATMLWNGERRMVHITVAAADGEPVEQDSELRKKLVAGINAARHCDEQVMIDSYHPLKFNVKTVVHVDRTLIVEDVIANVAKAIKEAFSFGNRTFGQAVTKSEVMAVIQRVTGVIALDLEHLYFTPVGEDFGDPGEPPPFLPAHIARWDKEKTCIESADLLTVNANGITVVEVEA
jgi:hypothetical protein